MNIGYFDGASSKIEGQAWAAVSPGQLAQDDRSKSASQQWNTIENALIGVQTRINGTLTAAVPGLAPMTDVQLQGLVEKVTKIMAKAAKNFAESPDMGTGIYVE